VPSNIESASLQMFEQWVIAKVALEVKMIAMSGAGGSDIWLIVGRF